MFEKKIVGSLFYIDFLLSCEDHLGYVLAFVKIKFHVIVYRVGSAHAHTHALMVIHILIMFQAVNICFFKNKH